MENNITSIMGWWWYLIDWLIGRLVEDGEVEE